MRKARNVPEKYPRTIGVGQVSWHTPIFSALDSAWRLQRYHLLQHYWLPAVRAFYTPGRHMTTNIADSLRLFDHGFRFVSLIQGESVHVATKNERIASVRWVNYRLTEDDKEKLQAEVLEMSAVIDDFADLVFHGYRLSVSYDDYSKAMQASLVCGAADNPDNGLGLSARHPDLDSALRSLLYKANLLGYGKWHEFASPSPVDSWS